MQPDWTMIMPLIAGYAADIQLGDPQQWPHPVKAFGYAIHRGTNWLNKGRYLLLKGAILTIVLCGVTWLFFFYSLALLRHLWLPGYYLLASICVFFGLAGTTLLREGQAVFDALEQWGLGAGRAHLSRIVGRETSRLTAQQVRIAVLESMSENLSDGVIAPLLFYAVGGVPGMMLYKMINTLDSMIGYKHEPYRLFGRFAARLDDVANFVPARVTALLMVLVTGSRRAAQYVWRYGSAHASPNAGYPESALAGILGCRFGGPNVYHGVVVVKPFIGEEDRIIVYKDFVYVKYINHAVTALTVAAIVLWG